MCQGSSCFFPNPKVDKLLYTYFLVWFGPERHREGAITISAYLTISGKEKRCKFDENGIDLSKEVGLKYPKNIHIWASLPGCKDQYDNVKNNV